MNLNLKAMNPKFEYLERKAESSEDVLSEILNRDELSQLEGGIFMNPKLAARSWLGFNECCNDSDTEPD